MKNKVDPVWIILEPSSLCVFNPNGGPLKKTAKTEASFLKKKLHDKNPSQLKDRRCRVYAFFRPLSAMMTSLFERIILDKT